MIYRSKAPLRIGFAGGGTDVSPYSDLYGGAVLNATISLYAKASIEPLGEKSIVLQTLDRGERCRYDLAAELPLDGSMDLLKGVYNRISRQYGPIGEGFCLSTFVDAPAGSGLGSSSTLVVAVIGAFAEWLKLPLGNYDIAHMAYEIERIELGIAGGKQDQYTAAFGGFNFMEFSDGDKVLVNSLRVHKPYVKELENNLLLYYTSTSRLSAEIIREQQSNVENDQRDSIEAMHRIRRQASEMKEALLKGNIDRMGDLFHEVFMNKKRMARSISNPMIDEIYDTARKAGALGGKISGAGGGGYMFFYCPDNKKYDVIKALNRYEGTFQLYHFVKDGLFTWSI